MQYYSIIILYSIQPRGNVTIEGKIKIWTSGCLKNQGKCWDNNKSPPLNGSKEGQLE